MGWEFIGVFAGIAFIAVIASIGLWRSGELRDLFNAVPEIDKQVERLASFYDKSYKDLEAKYEELKKKLDELLGKG